MRVSGGRKLCTKSTALALTHDQDAPDLSDCSFPLLPRFPLCTLSNALDSIYTDCVWLLPYTEFALKIQTSTSPSLPESLSVS